MRMRDMLTSSVQRTVQLHTFRGIRTRGEARARERNSTQNGIDMRMENTGEWGLMVLKALIHAA